MCCLQSSSNISFQISTARLLMHCYVFLCKRLTSYIIQDFETVNTEYTPNPLTISILKREYIFIVSALQVMAPLTSIWFDFNLNMVK